MPRDVGGQMYEEILKFDRLEERHLHALRTLNGIKKRSYAIRLLLARCLMEHDYRATIYHHAVYKNSMNALVLVFSRGTDPNCGLTLLPATYGSIVQNPYYLWPTEGPPRKLYLNE